MDRLVGTRGGDGRRAFVLPTVDCGRLPEIDALDRMSMAEFLDRRGLTSRRLRWYVEYACRDDYGCRLETTSAWAGAFYFASRVERPGARASELVTWPEGNGALVAHLEKVAAPRVRTGVVVTDVVPGPRSVEVHAWDVAREEAFVVEAGHAVFALPQLLAARLVAPYRERPPPHLAAFGYSPWVVANLTLRGRPSERGLPPGLGQRPPRLGEPRLRRGHAPGRAGPRPHRLDLVPAAHRRRPVVRRASCSSPRTGSTGRRW